MISCLARCKRGLLALAVGALCAFSFGQAPASTSALTLEDALGLAIDRNGNLRSALADLRSSQSARRSAYGAFLPTLTPSYSLSTGRTNFQTGAGIGGDGRQENADITLSWRLLDSGDRSTRFAESRAQVQVSEAQLQNQLRTILFAVHQRYYDALRAEEILRVRQAQQERAAKILDQTKTRVEVGDDAPINILQANADFLNARVEVLTANNRTATTRAELKAVIGWDVTEALPELARPGGQPEAVPPTELEEAFREATVRRPDVRSQLATIQSAKINIRQARIDGAVNFSLDANLRKNFAEDVFDRSNLQFTASIPLFDGRRSQETVRQRELVLESREAGLQQLLREVRAEVESAYVEFRQNQERLMAAQAALEAATKNFEAASESQTLGASDLIDVVTAQVSLVTAESNRVEAFYDFLISEVRWKLVTGQPLPGEEEFASL